MKRYIWLFFSSDCRITGRDYVGKRSFTKSGIPCQRWDQPLPHTHRFNDRDFPANESLTDASNYCRTPDGAEVPWCFTLDPDLRREDCQISNCSGMSHTTAWSNFSQAYPGMKAFDTNVRFLNVEKWRNIEVSINCSATGPHTSGRVDLENNYWRHLSNTVSIWWMRLVWVFKPSTLKFSTFIYVVFQRVGGFEKTVCF